MALSLGAGAATFALLSQFAEPTLEPGRAAVCWGLVVLTALAGAFLGLRSLGALRGVGATKLLGTRPGLASAARSALELANSPPPGAAPALIAAHARTVERRVLAVPPAEAAPWRSLRTRGTYGGLLALALAAALLGGSDRASAGAFALLHPGARDAGGTKVADLIAEVRYELLYPAYMNRAPESRGDLRVLEAPLGTTVAVTARPRLPLAAALLEAPGQDVRLRATGDTTPRQLIGRFVVREEGPLVIRATDAEGRRLRDARSRTLVPQADAAPTLSLLAPAEDQVVELGEPVRFRYLAEDSVGLESIELVVRTAEGELFRRQLEEFPPGDAGPLRHEGVGRTSAAEVGARPGDRLELWIEARDGDVVRGPNVGRSPLRLLTVASEATRRAAALAGLDAARNAGLDALADRLEDAVPAAEAPARVRHRKVRESAARYAEELRSLGDAAGGPVAPTVGRSVIREMAAALERALGAEARLHRATLGSANRRRRADGALVERLEGQVLLLTDLLARARLDDAAAVARELEGLRREMTSLLAELRRTRSPAAARALRGALRRAQGRLRELMERMSTLGQEVPREFVNADALPDAQATADALAELSAALEGDDLDGAERALQAFERQIDELARALGGAGEAYGEASFGPRERAMADALDRLAGLEAEQRTLAGRSEDVRRAAAERALDAAGDEAAEAARGLAAQAGSVAEALEGIDATPLGPMDRETHERAAQRVRDAADALEAGDLGEARRMAAEAAADAERLARDLELSALMFPGTEGRTARSAQAARRAARRAGDLERGLDEALPRLADFLEAQQDARLRGDGPRQGAAAGAAEALGQAFRAEPDGAPLSPEGAESVGRAAEAMRRAEGALGAGDPVASSRAQEEAARELSELRERLEQQQRASGGGAGGGEGGAGARPPRDRVRIPSGTRGDDGLRREVLDAMRRGAPRGYEGAVRRYYEELLR